MRWYCTLILIWISLIFIELYLLFISLYLCKEVSCVLFKVFNVKRYKFLSFGFIWNNNHKEITKPPGNFPYIYVYIGTFTLLSFMDLSIYIFSKIAHRFLILRVLSPLNIFVINNQSNMWRYSSLVWISLIFGELFLLFKNFYICKKVVLMLCLQFLMFLE